MTIFLSGSETKAFKQRWNHLMTVQGLASRKNKYINKKKNCRAQTKICLSYISFLLLTLQHPRLSVSLSHCASQASLGPGPPRPTWANVDLVVAPAGTWTHEQRGRGGVRERFKGAARIVLARLKRINTD